MPQGSAQKRLRGLAALLMLVALLLAGQYGAASAMHHVALGHATLIAVGASDGVPLPCQPDEPHGMPCCHVSACTMVVAPPQMAPALIPPVAGIVVAFLPPVLRQIGGAAPDPALRPPRAAI